MSTSSHAPTKAPPVPGVLWAFAWSFVAEGLLQLVAYGPKRDGVSLVGSVALGVAVISFFSVGVVRGRRVRTGIVAVLLALALVAQLLTLVVAPSVVVLVGATFTAFQGWLLWRYTGTSWWDWQRHRPDDTPSLAPILLVAVLAGILAGAADGTASQPVQVHLGAGS